MDNSPATGDGIRVSPEEEREGLDVGEHGMQAYTGLGAPSSHPALGSSSVSAT